jgi:type VI secretion system secreted protein Hcp
MKRLLAACALGLLSTLAANAGSLFLLLDGIPGESSDARHAGWIEPVGFSEGVARPDPLAGPVFEPLVIQKRIDKSSPLLALRCAEGRRITNGVMEAVRTDGKRLTFLKVKLAGLRVGACSESGRQGEDPVESVSFNFEKVEWTYTEFTADGKPLRNILCAWDRLTGTGKGGDRPADRDNDGLPDDYEILYGLDPDVPDADDDFDKDGVSNIDEFRAGTLPNQRDSVFRVSGERSPDGAVKLRWSRKADTGYRLLGAASPEGPYEFIRRIDETEEPLDTLDIQPTGDHQFFIIETE